MYYLEFHFIITCQNIMFKPLLLVHYHIQKVSFIKFLFNLFWKTVQIFDIYIMIFSYILQLLVQYFMKSCTDWKPGNMPLVIKLQYNGALSMKRVKMLKRITCLFSFSIWFYSLFCSKFIIFCVISGYGIRNCCSNCASCLVIILYCQFAET